MTNLPSSYQSVSRTSEYFDAQHHLGHKVGDFYIIRNARRARYMEIPGGPTLDWEKKSKREAFFKKIKEIGEENHCAFIRLRPDLLDSEENRKFFTDAGFRLAPMHLAAENTVILDLTKPEEELLSNMRRQTRYEVKRALKLKIEVSHDNSEKIFHEFHQVQEETASRQGFIPPSSKTLFAFRNAFGENAQIYIAKTTEGQPIAYGLILISGVNATYYEAASTELNRHLPGAYALQWQVIRDLKKQGIKHYNLWGIAPLDPSTGHPSTHHRFSGVTTFKTGFGGDVINFVPAFDYVLSRPRYAFDLLIESIRRRLRHL